jgi:hypothetical protein
MTTLTLPGLGDASLATAGARSRETDHADREDDPTPRGVVRAALGALVPDVLREYSHPVSGLRGMAIDGPFCVDPLALIEFEDRPLRVLDVAAGYGCWASEFRRLAGLQGWPVHIDAVEIFEPRRADLEKWCDGVSISHWRSMLIFRETMNRAHPGWDLAIGNPNFTALTHEDPEQSMPAVLLRHAPAVLLLHTQQAFARGEAGRRVWRAYPPAASWMVPGSVKFRTGINPKCPKCGAVNPAALTAGAFRQPVTNCLAQSGPTTYDGYEPICGAKLKSWGSDQRCYQVSLWLRDHEGPTALHMLPELDAAARRWTVPPGSEDPSEDLPAAPGWAP